jgi:DNA-binding XRE family transcriptional regulator
MRDAGPTIPKRLLARFKAGEFTVRELARLVGAAEERVSLALLAAGVDTSVPACKRRRFARRIEEAGGLPRGKANAAGASLYRQGHTLRQIAARLGCNKRAVRDILKRVDVAPRPEWNREVFRGPGGGRRPLKRFAAELWTLRQRRRLSQSEVAWLCGLSQATIWHLEAAVKGPTWETLHKLTAGLGVGPEELGVTWPAPPEKPKPSGVEKK